MIKELNIQNIQSHEYTSFLFHEGVNIIVGPSDSGKSAIIRALKKLTFNKPSGDAMCSHWGGKSRIEVFTDDAHVVWSKDKESEYILGDTHFKAFGTSVPQEISDALNLNEINLQQQLDSPFLLSETPGAVASHFNKVAKLDKIDLSTQNINGWIRELTSDIKYAEGQETSLKEGLEKFIHLEKFEIEVDVLEKQEKQLINIGTNRTRFVVIISKLKTLNEQIEKYEPLLELEEPLNKIFKLKEERNLLDVSFDSLYADIAEWYVLNTAINHVKDTILLETPVNNLLKLNKDRNAWETSWESLSKAIEDLNRIQVNLNTARVNYDSLHFKFEKEFPEICPLCGK